MQVTININGEELEVHGSLEKSGDGTVTPFTTDFEIDFVYYKGEEVGDLIEALGYDWTDIEHRCLSEIDGYYVP